MNKLAAHLYNFHLPLPRAWADFLNHAIYSTNRTPAESFVADSIAYEPLPLRHSDGREVTGMESVGHPEDKGVIVYLHGASGSAATSSPRTRFLAAEGYKIVVADYRGYGENKGRPNEAGLIADGWLFLEYAKSLAKGRPTYVIGHSIGAAVAIQLAAKTPIDGLITIAAFASLLDAAPFGAALVISDRYNNKEFARHIHTPWIIAHPKADTVLPHWHSVKLAQCAPKNSSKFLSLDWPSHAIVSREMPMLAQELEALRAAQRF